MKKLSFLFGIILLAFLFIRPAEAAVMQGFISDCLKVDASGHTANLSIKQGGQITPQGSEPTWVFVCITSEKLNGTKCTTGIASVDDNLFDKHDDLNAIKGIATSVGGVNGGKNPTQTNADGTAFTEAVSWSDEYHPAVIHQWSWVQADKAAGEGGVDTGGLGAQQQGTFDFSKLSGDTSKCVKIGWDPRGYVFDAVTLNPVKNVLVTLLKGPRGGTFTVVPSGLGLTNPDLSRATNGQYSFYVEPGFYKLQLSSTNAAIAPISSVKAAYQDLFVDDTGKTNIYQADQEVEEVKGSVAIAHIPVTVTDPSLLITTLQKLENGVRQEGGQINIFGRVSHPKSKIIMTMSLLNEAGETVNLVKTDTTNELGEYDKFIDQEQVDANDGKKLVLQNLNVSFELNPFYTTGVFGKSNSIFSKVANTIWDYITKKITVSAATGTSYDVKPIPTYIEGIAYDANGVAIPKAIVGVYTTYSNKPMYVTLADDEGHYKIGSQHLPSSTYELRYKKPTGEVIVVDTGTFIKQNVKYFASEGVKPFEMKKTSVAEDIAVQTKVDQTVTDTDITSLAKAGSSRGTGSNKVSTGNNAGNPVVPTVAAPATGNSSTQGIMMLIVVIFVFLLLGVGAFVMMKSKQSQAPPQF